MGAVALGIVAFAGGGFVLVRAAYGWAGFAPWLLTTALLALVAATTRAVVRRDVRTRLVLVTGLLVASVALVGSNAVGHDVLPEDLWNSRLYTTLLAALFAGATVGVVKRRPWARWTVLGLGVAGTLCGVMNLTNARHVLADHPEVYAALTSLDGAVPEWFATWLWTHALVTLGSASFLALLGGAAVREAFAVAHEHPDAVWSAPSTLVTTVKVTVVAQLVAATMSLLYAFAQPVVTTTRTSAIALAVAFAAAALVALARKTVGVLLLVGTGLGFAVQAFVTTTSAATARASDVAAYYGVFWSLAGLSAIACGVVLARTLFEAAKAPRV